MVILHEVVRGVGGGLIDRLAGKSNVGDAPCLRFARRLNLPDLRLNMAFPTAQHLAETAPGFSETPGKVAAPARRYACASPLTGPPP